MWLFPNKYKYWIVILYTWNEYTAICQIHLNWRKWNHNRKSKLMNTGWLPGARVLVEWTTGVKKYKLAVITKAWTCNLWQGDSSYWYCILHLKVADRVDFKFSSQKKKCNCVMIDVNLLWCSFHNIYKYHLTTLYTWN